MLVLQRKPGQKILMSNGITVMVCSVDGKQVRLGIDAPPDIKVHRAEVVERCPSSHPDYKPLAPDGP